MKIVDIQILSTFELGIQEGINDLVFLLFGFQQRRRQK